MTADFDWSGAPEGERWVRRGVLAMYYYVVTADGVLLHENHRWVQSGFQESELVSKGFVRVESARPVPRVGDRVRVSVEGTVLDSLNVAQVVNGAVILGLGTALQPDYTVEVLQRADPPLQPGDLVRDGAGDTWWINAKREFVRVFWADGSAAPDEQPLERDDIPGPLVKVELREVPSE